MPPLNIGVIGCGHIGRVVHLKNLGRRSDVKIVAVAEADEACRAAVQVEYPGTTPFNDYRELLELARVDAVVICLPNQFHFEAAALALQSRKHVYLEKPLAIDLSEGKKLVEHWRSSGRVGMIGFNYRFNPLHQELNRQIRAGRAGEIIGVRSVFTTTANRLPQWKQARATGGGVLLDLAAHHIDLVRFFFDQPIVEVRATVRSDRTEADTATLEMRLGNGVVTQSLFSMSAVDDDRFEIYGRSGKLSIDRYRSWQVEFVEAKSSSPAARLFQQLASGIPRTRFALRKLRTPLHEPSYAAALGHFVEAARAGRQTRPDFEDGIQSLAAVLAAEQSAETGQPVRLPVQP